MSFIQIIVVDGLMSPTFLQSKAFLVGTKADLLQLKLIHLFVSELLLMKKLEKKTKPTFILSVLKVEN